MGSRALVIGSGVAGLTAGIILAKAGYRVCVLEGHTTPGGLLQVYSRKGCTIPTGVHAVSAMAPGEPLWRYFKYLGVLDTVEWQAMDPEGFITYSFPGMEFSFPSDRQACKARLIEAFPKECAAIRTYFSDMASTVAQFPLYNLDPAIRPQSSESFTVTLSAYLASITDCEPLRSILSALNPFLGVKPDECPLAAYFLMMDSFLGGAYRVNHAQTPLADALIDALGKAGGILRTRAPVVAVLHAGGKVRGVRLEDGEEIGADQVIYTGHPKALYGLCGDGVFRPAFVRRIEEAPDTPGMVGVGVAWHGDDCPVSRRDMMLYNSWDTGSHYDCRLLSNTREPLSVYWAGAISDSGGPCSTVALSFSPFEEWAGWANSVTGRRPDDYYEAKRSAAERIMTMLERRWPDQASTMSIVDVFTPLSLRDFTRSPRGSAYGQKKSVSGLRHGWLSPVTRLKGLILAGQSIVMPGILGSVTSSVAACAAILGRDGLVQRIIEETQ